MDHSATYNPEDNKIRIYPGQRLDDELGDRYADFKASGYKWASKQECFVCARWTPAAEDWALELCGEIGDEDYSAVERSADRAERFGDYRDKRRGEAHGAADSFDAGPGVYGHQNRGRAERQARRHDRHRSGAISQWSKAEYWQSRTAGVISHALHKSSPTVRRGRILTLEAEQRKHEKSRADYAKRFLGWRTVADQDDAGRAFKLAYILANTSSSWGEYVHPRTGKKTCIYSLLTDSADPITGAEAATLWLKNAAEPDADGSWCARWSDHYNLRLTYERAMLENEGGSAAAVEIEPGGWVRGLRCHTYSTAAPSGWAQVHAVVRSPATKRITSVKVMGIVDAHRTGQTPGIVTCNIERLGEDAYRAATPEELAEFKAAQTEAKQERAAATKANQAPSLLNPSDGDAERLQQLWNDQARERHEAKKTYSDFVPSEVVRMTQAKYSAASKGSYSSLETRTLHACGKLARRSSNMWTSEGQAYDATLGPVVCKLRIACAAGSSWSSPRRLIIITDKPQKPLPLDWATLYETPAEVAPVVVSVPVEPVAAGQLF